MSREKHNLCTPLSLSPSLSLFSYLPSPLWYSSCICLPAYSLGCPLIIYVTQRAPPPFLPLLSSTTTTTTSRTRKAPAEARGAMQEVGSARRVGNASRRSRGASAAASRASLLPLALLVGAACAIVKDLPDGYRVLHANVILRHGQRTRLLKTTGEGEFGVSDDVVVSAFASGKFSGSSSFLDV